MTSIFSWLFFLFGLEHLEAIHRNKEEADGGDMEHTQYDQTKQKKSPDEFIQYGQ